MGSICGSSDDTQTTTSESSTSLPSFITDAARSTIDRASDLADDPYPLYGQQRDAPLDPLENKGINLTAANVGTWRPSLYKAKFTTDQGRNYRNPALGKLMGMSGSSFVDPGNVDKYMNPYIQAVIDRVKREGAISRQGIEDQAHAASAFGDTRHGVAAARQREGEQRNVGELLAGGYGQAANIYATDMGRRLQALATSANVSDREIARRLQAAAQMAELGGAQSRLGFQDAAAQLQSGAYRRSIDQLNMDTAYQDFLQQRDWPVDRGLNVMLAALRGTPYETTGREIVTQPDNSPSPAQQIIGLLAGGAGLASNFF